MVFPDSHWFRFSENGHVFRHLLCLPTQFGAFSGNKNLPNYAKAKKRMTGLEFLTTLECKGNTNTQFADFVNLWMYDVIFYIIQLWARRFTILPVSVLAARLQKMRLDGILHIFQKKKTRPIL